MSAQSGFWSRLDHPKGSAPCVVCGANLYPLWEDEGDAKGYECSPCGIRYESKPDPHEPVRAILNALLVRAEKLTERVLHLEQENAHLKKTVTTHSKVLTRKREP